MNDAGSTINLDVIFILQSYSTLFSLNMDRTFMVIYLYQRGIEDRISKGGLLGEFPLKFLK